MNKFLIIGSGKSAFEYFNYPYKKKEWKIVTVNNAWKLTDDWDFNIHTSQCKEKPVPNKNQIATSNYREALDFYGGHKACGFSIMLCASYWILWKYKPDVIGYLGADMNYTPDEKGHTHFYGVGYDIQKNANNLPDPDKMVIEHGKGDANYLSQIYMRFYHEANKTACPLYNFSSDESTRLPYPKNTPEKIDAS